jgi:hypothetical protein
VITARIDTCQPGIDGAAEIGIGPDFSTLFLPGDHVGPRLEGGVLSGDFSGELIIEPRMMNSMKPPDHAKVTVDVVLFHETAKVIQRGLPLLQDANGQFRAIPPR